jgi:uncharacterized protein
MVLVDVNILVAAHRHEDPQHERICSWLERELSADRAYGFCELVLSGFVRIVTHPKIFRAPTPVEIALEYVEAIRGRANAHPVKPGARHWPIFLSLCREIGARGNDVPDAYLAALAIEHGCDWVSLDRGFERFKGLRWRLPPIPETSR